MECIFALRSQSEDVDGKTSRPLACKEAQRICIARLAHPWAKQAGRAHDAAQPIQESKSASHAIAFKMVRLQTRAIRAIVSSDGNTRPRFEQGSARIDTDT